MRALDVVLPAIGLDDDDSLPRRWKPFGVEAFITELAVERLVQSVLPRLARVAVRRRDVSLLEPIAECLRDELRTVVRAQVSWRTSGGHETSDDVDDKVRVQRTKPRIHRDRSALPSDFVEASLTAVDDVSPVCD